MREIKFRGKSIDTGKWIYGYACFDSKKENAAIINRVGNNEMQHWAVYPETVSEFTGLHDRNGREIYEGDVYQVAKNVIYQIVFVGTPEVFEDEALMGGFGLQRIENADVIIPFDTYAVKHGEIIGDIYENPELING